jgi:hypothetical protein
MLSLAAIGVAIAEAAVIGCLILRPAEDGSAALLRAEILSEEWIVDFREAQRSTVSTPVTSPDVDFLVSHREGERVPLALLATSGQGSDDWTIEFRNREREALDLSGGDAGEWLIQFRDEERADR